MKLRASLAALGAAIVLGTTGTLALPAVAASAHSSTHTLTFISLTRKSATLTKTSGASRTPTSTRRARPSGSTCSTSGPPRQAPAW